MKAVFFLLVVKVVSIHGHAFLMDPPYRAYAAGYSTPQGMNCGGISVSFFSFIRYAKKKSTYAWVIHFS